MRRIGVLMPAAADEPGISSSWRRSSKGCNNGAGSMAATCGSTFAGPRAMRGGSSLGWILPLLMIRVFGAHCHIAAPAADGVIRCHVSADSRRFHIKKEKLA
jgi:hypothetical protein